MGIVVIAYLVWLCCWEAGHSIRTVVESSSKYDRIGHSVMSCLSLFAVYELVWLVVGEL